MADFKQAVKWMKEGKKVRRKFNLYCSFSIENGDFDRGITFADVEATDWEILEEKIEEENNMKNRCERCGGEIELEKPKESLSDKIYKSALGAERCPDSISTEDVKEKIQNAQRRLKEEIDEFRDSGFSFRNWKTIMPQKIDEIFKEEFGGDLL